MTERVALYRRKLFLLAVGWMAIAGPVVIAQVSAAQSSNNSQARPPASMAPMAADANPSFEVATIKPSNPNAKPEDDDIGYVTKTGTFETVDQSLKDIMKFAYHLSLGANQQIIGGPKWIGSAKFDIQTKTDEEAIAARQKLTKQQQDEQVRQMVQALLADRFKLKVHRETRMLPVYLLTVMKSGSKILTTSRTQGSKGWDGFKGRPGRLEARACTMELLVVDIAAEPEIGGHLVLDRTGLTGKYDFLLKWTPDPTLGVSSQGRDAGVTPDPSAPTFFTAVQEQLGLKLEPTKAPVEVLVIDHVEMPSEN